MTGPGPASAAPVARPGRSAAVDLVRVIGMVAVVVGHVWYVPEVARWTYSWHVPAFFVVAGYLWNPDRTFRVDLSRRVHTVVRPYVAWWCVVLAAYLGHAWYAADGPSLPRIAYAAWGGVGAWRPWSAFWFFSAFFVAVMVVRACGRRWWLAVAISGGALLLCAVAEPWAGLAPLAVLAGVACALFVLAGVLLRTRRTHLPAPGTVGATLVVLGLAGVAVPGYRPLEIKEADFGTPVLAVVAAMAIGVGLILVAETVAPLLSTGVAVGLGAISTVATGVFLGHGIVLTWLDTPWSGAWVDFALVLGVPLAVSFLLARTRAAPWFLGRAREPRRAATTARPPG